MLFQPYWTNQNRVGVEENKQGILANIASILGLQNRASTNETRITTLEDTDITHAGRLTGVETTSASNTGRIVTLEEDVNGVELAITGKANTSGTYSGLRAQATTKDDVGLGNVANYGVTTSVSSTSSTTYATASAVRLAYNLAASKISANQVYAGTSDTNTSYPIGSVVSAFVGAPARTNLSEHFTLYVGTSATYWCFYSSHFTGTGKGAALSGSWALRGFSGVAWSTNVGLFERVA
jgi:hypothetical protein